MKFSLLYSNLPCRRKQKNSPREYREKNDGEVIPDRLDVLELGGEVAFEIVFDKEDPEEIRIAAAAEDIPGEGGEAEAGNGAGKNTADGIAPALGDRGPENNSAATENERRRSFR